MKEPGIEPGFFAFGGWTNNRENVSKCTEIALRCKRSVSVGVSSRRHALTGSDWENMT